MKRMVLLILSMFVLILSVSGCAPELYERLLISAIGVDKTEDGCRVTVLAAETTEAGGQSTFSENGKTVPEALGAIARASGRTPLYSHNAAIIFGRRCAEQGIGDCLDFFIRHYDARPTAKVFLAEDSAEAILTSSNLRAEQFAQIASGAESNGLSADQNLLHLVNGLYGTEEASALLLLREGEIPTPVGTGLLQKDRLCAVLSLEETQGLCALRGTLGGSTVTVQNPSSGTVSLKIRCAESSVRFTGTAQAPRFLVAIHADAEISSISKTALHIENTVFPQLESALAAYIEQCIKAYLYAANGCGGAYLREAVYRSAPCVLEETKNGAADFLRSAEFAFSVSAAVQRVEEENIPYL